MVEIYGLFDPTSNELRYVGKAKDAAKRLKRHLCESRTHKRPVNNWIKSLTADGKLPRMEVLETVPADQWQAAEIRLIALHRQTCKLLNVADGGDMPHQTVEQRKAAGDKGRKAIAKVCPKLKAFWQAKAGYARMATNALKRGDMKDYEDMRQYMLNKARTKPEWYGDCWASK
jgi:hypothetical protein